MPEICVEIEVVLGGVHDLEPLAVGLHEAVLDPVVHHLHEVAGTGRADMGPAVFGRERAEDRLEPFDGLVGAAGHQAEALLQPPDTARDADVDEVDSAVRTPPRFAA